MNLSQHGLTIELALRSRAFGIFYVVPPSCGFGGMVKELCLAQRKLILSVRSWLRWDGKV